MATGAVQGISACPSPATAVAPVGAPGMPIITWKLATTVPVLVTVQAVPQSMPAGVEVTVPTPAPFGCTSIVSPELAEPHTVKVKGAALASRSAAERR